ncbi:MAG: hypothetical protein ACKVQW_07760 [Pyrinomonadaceae bacterium]
MKRITLLLVVLTLLSVSGQGQKSKSKVKVPPPVTEKIVRDSLRGESISGSFGTWNFEPNELLEVDIISQTRIGGQRIARVWIKTSDGINEVEGRMQVTFNNRLAVVRLKDMGLRMREVGGSASTFISSPSATYESAGTQTSIANTSFHVKASGWRWFPFSLQRTSRVSGRFVGEGGGIEGFIMTSDEFVNWSNNNSYRHFYKSGVVTIGNIDVTLPPGRYELVFYNSNLLSGKTVSANVSFMQ